jgi:hypothetical protein
MRSVPLCGRRVVERLRSIGISRLSDLAGKDPAVLMHQVNLAAGKVIWRPPMAIIALSNLIATADKRENRAGTRDRASSEGSLTAAQHGSLNLLRRSKRTARGRNSKPNGEARSNGR